MCSVCANSLVFSFEHSFLAVSLQQQLLLCVYMVSISFDSVDISNSRSRNFLKYRIQSHTFLCSSILHRFCRIVQNVSRMFTIFRHKIKRIQKTHSLVLAHKIHFRARIRASTLCTYFSVQPNYLPLWCVLCVCESFSYTHTRTRARASKRVYACPFESSPPQRNVFTFELY